MIIYKKVIQDMDDNVITRILNTVTERDEIINIAMRYSNHDKYTIHSVGIPNIRCLSVLGLDVQFMFDDLNEYKNFTDVYIKKYDRLNIKRVYDTYYLPLVNKFTLDKLKTGEVDGFLEWTSNMITNSRKKDVYLNVLTAMSAHQDIINIVQEYSDTIDVYNDIISLYCQCYDKGSFTNKYIQNLLEELTHVHDVKDIQSLSLDKALNYCRSKHNSYIYIQMKINILELLKCSCIEEIKELHHKANNRHTHWNDICHGMDVKYNGYSFILEQLEKIYDTYDLYTIKDMCVEHILYLYNTIQKHKQLTYKVLFYLLKEIPSKLKVLQDGVSNTNKSINVSDSFTTTPWRTNLLKEIMDKHIERITTTSAYVDDLGHKLKYSTVVMLLFISDYAKDKYRVKINIEDPLRWFLYMANIEMIEDVILTYGKSINAHNDRVKNQQNTHHASRYVSRMISFFINSVNHLIPCAKDVEGLKLKTIIDQIENQRILPNSNIRRTFTDEEVERMMNVVKDVQMSLLFVIFREVALRGGCISRLKYSDIIDEYHYPRHTCKVIEKGNKVREFVTSPNLKQHILKYITWVSNNRTQMITNTGIYVFSHQPPYDTPLCTSTMRCRLKKIAFTAGVTDVNVHPHAFRHTLVGKLMSEGNSCEIVSKFMGHSSVDTTINYYWVQTIDDLTRNLKNPFISRAYTTDEIKDEHDEDMKKLQRKLDAALEIIFIYNTHITNAVQSGATASDVHKNICTEIPNLPKLLRGIEETIENTSSADSTNSSQSYTSFI
jgi:integrase